MQGKRRRLPDKRPKQVGRRTRRIGDVEENENRQSGGCRDEPNGNRPWSDAPMTTESALKRIGQRDDAENCRDGRQDRMRLKKGVIERGNRFGSPKLGITNDDGFQHVGNEEHGGQHRPGQHQPSVRFNPLPAYLVPTKREYDSARNDAGLVEIRQQNIHDRHERLTPTLLLDLLN